jgi:hypothetical protein
MNSLFLDTCRLEPSTAEQAPVAYNGYGNFPVIVNLSVTPAPSFRLREAAVGFSAAEQHRGQHICDPCDISSDKFGPGQRTGHLRGTARAVMRNVRFTGLFVAETIAVAVAELDGDLIKKLGSADQLQVCYEAGADWYVVYWQLSALGVKCEVVAPTLVPVKAGDRVKTDRRDALKLARSYGAGDLTAVWIPDAAQEALWESGASPGSREERLAEDPSAPGHIPIAP